MRYCERNNCNNVLNTVAKQSSVVYRCLVCLEEYPLSDKDTLMIDEHLQENNTIHKYKSYLQNAHDDRIVELTYRNCPGEGCKETIVNVVKLAKNGQSLYICPTCKHQFN